MAQIAFILLCHKDPDAVIAQATALTAADDFIAIHFDARAPLAQYERIRTALAGNSHVTFARKRVKCGWGEWSLVRATLNAIQAACDAFPRASHFYMLSGDCAAIKTAQYVHAFLDRNDRDYIESVDYFQSDWIKTGLKAERLIYRHLFNERTHKRMFYASLNLQQRLGLARAIPADLQMMIGSQWWCLRRQTIEAILDFTVRRRDVMRFFSTTWIPDETFFQTLVRHLVPEPEIENRTLTFLMFSDYGMPVTFYNDHYDLLLNQDYLFARKISPQAQALKERLGALYLETGRDFAISNEGQRLYAFLTGRGREGHRFAPRFWMKESSLGRDRELLIVTCKKWHVAKRLLAAIKQQTNLPAIEYLFNEENTELPDLGGIQRSLEKRTRHRRALVRMLFDYYQTNRMVICMDTSMLALIDDFYADRCTTRLLEIACEMSDDYLLGHAMRIGLAGPQTERDTLNRLIPTIRNDVYTESDHLRDRNYPEFYRLRESASIDENAAALAGFLSTTPQIADVIAQTDHLFSD